MNEQLITLIKDFCKASYEEEVSLLRTICQIPSPTRHEELRAHFICNWLRKEGATDVVCDDVHNVCCLLGNFEAYEILLFSAHTDIVFSDTEPLPLVERDGLLYCPGIGDNTANVAGLLLATRFWIAHPELLPQDRGVLIVFNTCEEGLGNLDGIKAVFERYAGRITEHVSFDLYLPQVISRAVGSIREEIEVRTQGGHSWHDYGRPNAIHHLSAIICDLYALELPKGATINVGRIEGGTTVNAIAEHARALAEFRSCDNEELRALRSLLEVIASAHASDEIEVSLRVVGMRPGSAEVDKDALEAMTRRNAEIVRAVTGEAADVCCASTDANIALSRGVLANTVGAVTGALLHTRAEWIDPTSLKTGLEVILRVMGGSWMGD